jgi:hypothetical protein
MQEMWTTNATKFTTPIETVAQQQSDLFYVYGTENSESQYHIFLCETEP